MQVHAVNARPAQVIRHPGGLDAPGEGFHLAQVIFIERVGAADGQRDPVQHNRIFGAQPFQEMHGSAARQQVILGQRFQPADAAAVLTQQVFIMRRSYAQAEAKRPLNGSRC